MRRPGRPAPRRGHASAPTTIGFPKRGFRSRSRSTGTRSPPVLGRFAASTPAKMEATSIKLRPPDFVHLSPVVDRGKGGADFQLCILAPAQVRIDESPGHLRCRPLYMNHAHSITMTTPRFSVAPNAAEWLLEQLCTASKDSRVADLTPGLYLVFSEQTRDKQGKLVAECLVPFIALGWYEAEVALARGYAEWQLHGQRILIEPETMACLNGRHLVLRTVEVGVPTLGSRTRQVLDVGKEQGSEEDVGSPP